MRLLLSRDDFRNGTFERDHFQCVVCGLPAVDAHHLWTFTPLLVFLASPGVPLQASHHHFDLCYVRPPRRSWPAACLY